MSNNGNWWSATENDASNAYNRNMNYNSDNMNLNNNNKNRGRSVRCVKDCSKEGISPPLFHELMTAYYAARRYKRNTKNQLIFERDLESQLLKLEHELLNYTYELSPSVCFINDFPIKREIVAADFRDRVVHHLLCGRINPIFDRQFIHDSYSCRVGKGTLFGIKRAQGFLRGASSDFKDPCWVLRLDIKGFFMAINRRILYNLTLKGLDKVHWSGVDNVDLTKYLLKKIIFNDPLDHATFRSLPQKWIGLPQDKSLIGSSVGCGLPIGNLTSQLFANIYLNPLDHYIKRSLHIKYYGRYVDDMLFVHSDKNKLQKTIGAVKMYLKNELKLTLHPKKIKLQEAHKGFDFLGARLYPNKVLPGKRILNNFSNSFKYPYKNVFKQQNRVKSYEGIFKHFRYFKSQF
ncbi:MAG: hypothetical protein GX801_08320 [Fibrobacter sp.]|nr:hypothetical protein [Fibrobacter sp.]